jgi:hypothetical protein
MFTLTFLKIFGKQIGFDYDPPHEGWYDDWDSNVQAYTFFSFFWFLLMPILIVIGLYQLIIKFTTWFLNFPNERI